MTELSDLQAIISDAVDKISYPKYPEQLYEPLTYILSIGGKRMRPALLLMACELFGGDVNKAIQPALAIEVFHNFTLMHDDIMDNAPLRRGKTTVHERWNKNVAILSGDVMLIEGYKLMMQVEDRILRQVMDIFNETAVGVCEGQQIDMEFETRDVVDINEYINMIRLKTAVVLGVALKIGALIGGAPQQDADLLSRFGEQLGVAFQLQDDILDVYGDPEKFGKQVGGDIISNKKTFLLIEALTKASGETKVALDYWLSLPDFAKTKKVAAVTNIYNSLNIRALAEEKMNDFFKKGFEAFDKLAAPEERKKTLIAFAKQLIDRES